MDSIFGLVACLASSLHKLPTCVQPLQRHQVGLSGIAKAAVSPALRIFKPAQLQINPVQFTFFYSGVRVNRG